MSKFYPHNNQVVNQKRSRSKQVSNLLQIIGLEYFYGQFEIFIHDILEIILNSSWVMLLIKWILDRIYKIIFKLFRLRSIHSDDAILFWKFPMLAVLTKVHKEFSNQFEQIDSFDWSHMLRFGFELKVNGEFLLLLFYFSSVDEMWAFFWVTFSGVHD